MKNIQRRFNNTNELIEWLESLNKISKDYSLEKMRKLDSIFSYPTSDMNYIHVAGTNGKGSIVSGLKSVLLTKELSVGSFISPYVTVFNERISYNNDNISDDELLELGNYIISKYDIILKEMEELSFSEFITILAFIYFKRKKVNIAIIEVGLGGSFDPTNIITPLVSVIGQIDYDHCDILGNDILEIASNKLGIVKKGVPFVALNDERINDLLDKTSNERSSKLYYVNKDNINDVVITNQKTGFCYQNIEYKTNLLGFHQAENMSIVIETINVLNEFYNYNICYKDILNGLSNIKHYGRLQIIKNYPLVILDGAHNPNGMERLIQFVSEIKTNKKIIFVTAISKNKDSLKMLKSICDVCDLLYLTTFNNSNDAVYLKDLVISNNLIDSNNVACIESFKDIEYNEKNTIYILCGSLYFIKDVLKEHNL